MNARPIAVVITVGILLASPPVVLTHEATKPKKDAREGGAETAEEVGPVCKLRIEVIDREMDKQIPCLVRIFNSDGSPRAIPELLDRCVGLPGDARKLGWHVLLDAGPISVPQKPMTIEVAPGLEYSSVMSTVDLTGKAEETVSYWPTRLWNAAERGMVSGNTHLHLKDLSREEADRYLREVPVADGLDIVFVSYLERALVDRTYITNGHTREDLAALSTDRLRFGNGEEYRHNFGGGGEGYGHVMFLDLPKLIKPASVGPGITKRGNDGTPLRPGIEQARDQGATVVWCHNGFGFEDLPNWTGGLLHAQNIFDGGNRGSYEDSFYRYLDIGLRVPFSTGTDWFIYDYSRVYADLGDEKSTVRNWLEALRAGRTFITNGPLLEFSVGDAGPGDVIERGEPPIANFRAVSRHAFEKLEIVVNGKSIRPDVIEYRNFGPWFEARGKAVIMPTGPSWIALRVVPDPEVKNEFGRPLFAHTSPVYVTVDGKNRFVRETAEELMTEIEASILAIEKDGRFDSDAEKEAVLGIYRQGRGDLVRLLGGP